MKFLFKRAESTESTTVRMQYYTRARTRYNLWMSPVTLNICSVDTFAFVSRRSLEGKEAVFF